MELIDIMKSRHSVRQYTHRNIEDEVKHELRKVIEECNKESGLNIQIFFNEPKCFQGMMAHYGKFRDVQNYIALVGHKDDKLEEKAGYYGEKIVLKAQELGLNTCWVALTHGKSEAIIKKGEKLACLISIGYGVNQGVPHKSKPMDQLCKTDVPMPEWFQKGMEAVMLAPTSLNQQKFEFRLENNQVYAKAKLGFYTKTDLGIVKYHFESVTGHKVL